MSRPNIARPAWFALFLLSVIAAGLWSQAPSPAELRARSQKLLKDGNFKEAYDGFQRLALDPKTEPRQVSSDLTNGVQCLANLGRIDEFDALVEGTVAAHKDDWRLLWTAAQQYIHAPHQGFMIAGKYERGGHRGGGEMKNSVERDRVRALQLMQQAMPLAQQDDDKPEVSRFFLSLGELLLNQRGHYEAWRLQYLTDLTTLPDYEEGHFYYREYNGAPVDAEGNPVYHSVPKSWEAAKTDGERWRWALAQAIENSPDQLNEVRMHLAQFFQQQFGVQSMAQGGRWGRGFAFGPIDDDDTEKNESGTYELHTLKENETIAKLASGIERFELPDEFNYLKIYRQIIAEPKTGQAEQAYHQLAQVFANRRQYPTAATLWRENIEEFGPGSNNWKQQQLDQIVGNWGQFEATSAQPAGKGATVDFRFRNAKRVAFDAKAIKVALLLDDVKAYLKSDPANRIDWNKVNLGNIGYRLVHENETKYVGEEVAKWELELEPRASHFDRRITVTTPLQKGGAYLVTANVAGGNVSKIVLWVADTAIVQKNLSGQSLYFVADAV